MGYDMHWRETDPSEKAAIAVAKNDYHVALEALRALPDSEAGKIDVEKARNADPQDVEMHDAYEGRTARYREAKERVTAASNAIDDANVSYFRLNIWGMQKWREIMWELGMVIDAGQYPEWPSPEDFGITYEVVEGVEYPDTDGPPLSEIDQEKAKNYLSARDNVLAWHGDTSMRGIPIHKFGSNDGWIVTPEECGSALWIYAERLRDLGEETVYNLLDNMGVNRGYWGQWLAYLRGAADHGGFQVF